MAVGIMYCIPQIIISNDNLWYSMYGRWVYTLFVVTVLQNNYVVFSMGVKGFETTQSCFCPDFN